MDFSPYIFFALRVYTSLSNRYNSIKKSLSLFYDGFTYALSDKLYVLFENIPTPYLVSSVNIGSPSSAVPQWYYNPATNTFVFWKLGLSPESLQETYDHYTELPILSMEVTHGDECVHNLDDFVDSLTFYKPIGEKFPSIAHIIGAWSLSSKIVLESERDFRVAVTTTTAEYVRVPIYTHKSVDSIVATERVPKIE